MARSSKHKSERQFKFLLSGGSPLTKKQKEKLVAERRSGAVKVTRMRRKR